MKRPNEIAVEEQSMTTLTELTSAFEGIASMRISQIRDQVLQSTKFFNELWHIYSQLRIDTLFSFGRDNSTKVVNKELYIIITAEGGFSGDIDQKLVDLMLQTYDPATVDIIVIGHHGATQLAQRGVAFKKYFKMPHKDRNINVGPITELVQQYRSTKLFYQEYVSLMVQDVKRIELSAAITQKGSTSERSEDVISEENYIFEPSSYAVAAHLERSMMQISISQLILESKLAQYASRFRAMSASHQRADEMKDDLRLDYNRAKRAVKDERLKEIINGLKKGRAAAAGSRY
ncbi:MAG TPA: F0F1 ATP synthase subunit gamma [Candidatus Saccharimonadales bacterium]|jgi:F-type H+-transporting ATPase subunit gamma|nr:F0F1 ATP synthase subunit gamma [Candidatus Saccharimonadales bacterium]